MEEAPLEGEGHLDEEHQEAEDRLAVLEALLEVEGAEEASLLDEVVQGAAALVREGVAGSETLRGLSSVSFPAWYGRFGRIPIGKVWTGWTGWEPKDAPPVEGLCVSFPRGRLNF